MYVIAGVSGNTGSVVADTLLAQGKQVRVIVRDAAKGEPWRARGAEVAVADLADTPALTAALRGATGAYLLLPPRPTSLRPREDYGVVSTSLAAAVAAAKVPHVVLLSSIGAQHTGGNGPIATVHDAEGKLATVTQLTALRAAYFLENWGASLGMLDQGVLPSFLPTDRAIPMIATRDIGVTAARALVEGPHGHQVIELAAPRDYSPDDIAAALTAITGKPVRAQQFPLDGVVPTFTQFGISVPVAELYREMYAGFATEHVRWEGKGRAVRGTVTAKDVLAAIVARP
jgi:uncharacterized protein YbjT (DUF2867 family)